VFVWQVREGDALELSLGEHVLGVVQLLRGGLTKKARLGFSFPSRVRIKPVAAGDRTGSGCVGGAGFASRTRN